MVSESDCSTSSHCGGTDSIRGPVQWVKGSGIAAAVAQIQPLAWEIPYALIAARKRKKKKKRIALRKMGRWRKKIDKTIS